MSRLRLRPALRHAVRVSGAGAALPFVDAFALSDGALGSPWSGATWAIVSGRAVNTPTPGAELIVNGGFGADTDWAKGANWTIGGGVATKTAGGNNNIQEDVLTIGGWYQAVWTLATYTGSSSFAAGFGASVTSSPRTTPGTYTDTARATGISARINGGSAAAGTVDNVSYKQITLATLFNAPDWGRPDVNVSVKVILAAGNRAGLVCNLDSVSAPANFVTATHDGVNARLSKCVAGTYTDLINTAATYVSDAVLEIRQSVDGTYQLFYNLSQVGADQVIADAAILAATRHGLCSASPLCSLDAFNIAAN